MCSRYSLKSTGVELQEELGLDEVPVVAARYNIAPTQAAMIVTDASPRTLTTAQWGLIPHWAIDATIAHQLINARAEGIDGKRAFKDVIERRRCLVVADGFYEWKHHGKQRTPWYVTLASHRPFTFAGLWESWNAPNGLLLTTFTIITTAANEFMAPLHERMPVLLSRDDRARWLSHEHPAAEAMKVLEPWHGEPLQKIEVSPHVNKVTVDDPKCIEPATQVQLSLL